MRLIGIAFLGMLLAAPSAPGQHACATGPGIGRRVVTSHELAGFTLPRFAKVVKVRDIDYEEYRIAFGPAGKREWMRIMFGPYSGMGQPNELGNAEFRWTLNERFCGKNRLARDYTGAGPDDRRWRHIGFPFGFAVYEGVSPKAAAYFDRILSTLCCGRGWNR